MSSEAVMMAYADDLLKEVMGMGAGTARVLCDDDGMAIVQGSLAPVASLIGYSPADSPVGLSVDLGILCDCLRVQGDSNVWVNVSDRTITISDRILEITLFAEGSE